MKNFIQPGNTLELTAPDDMASGEARLVGTLLGVAVAAILSGKKGSMLTEGVVELPKAVADVMAEGSAVNWDDTAKVLKNASTDKDGAAKTVEAADSAATSVLVKLQP